MASYTERQVLQAVHSQMEANKSKTEAETQGQVIENARDALLLQAQEQIRNKNAQDAYNNQWRRAVSRRMKYGGSAFNLQEVVNNSPYLSDLFERMGVTNIQDTIDPGPDGPDGPSGPHPSNPLGQGIRDRIIADTGMTPDMYNDPWKRDVINRATFIAFDKNEGKWKMRYMPMMWAEAGWDEQSDDEQVKYAQVIKGLSEALLMPEPTDAGGEATLKSGSSAKGKASGPGDAPEVTAAKVEKLQAEAYEALKGGDADGALEKLRLAQEATVQPESDAKVEKDKADAKKNEAHAGLYTEMANLTVEQIKALPISEAAKNDLMSAQEFKAAQEGRLAAEKNLVSEQERKYKEEDREHVKRTQILDENLKKAEEKLKISQAELNDRKPVTPTENANPEVRKREAQLNDYKTIQPFVLDINNAVKEGNIEELERLASPEVFDETIASTAARVQKGRDELYTDTQAGRILKGLASAGAITKEKLDTLGQAVGPVDNLTKAFLKTFVEDKYVEVDSAEMDAIIGHIESFIRNDLYGATLTDNELKYWKRIAFNEGKANLKSSLIAFNNIVKNRLSDIYNGYTDAMNGRDLNRQIIFGRGIAIYKRAIKEIETKIASIGPEGNTIRSEERTADDLL